MCSMPSRLRHPLVRLVRWGLTFAAGAMLYVISNEIIPETHRHGQHKGATADLIVGAVVMMFLDVVFG